MSRPPVSGPAVTRAVVVASLVSTLAYLLHSDGVGYVLRFVAMAWARVRGHA